MSIVRGFRAADEAAYSLVEVMVVIAVTGIILGIAAPTIQNQIAIQQIRGAGQEVMEVLRDARDSAMNEGVPRYVRFTPPRTYQVWMYRASSGQWVADGPATALPNSVEFDAADVTFPSVSDAPTGTGQTVPQDAAYFDTRGRYPFEAAATSSYSITLRGGVGRTITLTVWRNTGQVTGL